MIDSHGLVDGPEGEAMSDTRAFRPQRQHRRWPRSITPTAAVPVQHTAAAPAGTAADQPRHRQTRSRTFPVQVRSMNDPNPGWTVDRALGRLAQGYSVEHVSSLSGYAVSFLRAQLTRALAG